MDALVPAGWSEFAVAAAGATAALSGLVIVAISVNVREILAYPTLVARSAATITGFVVSLLASLALLVPQALAAAGIEVLIATVVAAAIEVRALRADLRQEPTLAPTITWGHFALAAVWILALLVAGALMSASVPAGLFILAAGIGAAIIASIVTTWVLLIEILR